MYITVSASNYHAHYKIYGMDLTCLTKPLALYIANVRTYYKWEEKKTFNFSNFFWQKGYSSGAICLHKYIFEHIWYLHISGQILHTNAGCKNYVDKWVFQNQYVRFLFLLQDIENSVWNFLNKKLNLVSHSQKIEGLCIFLTSLIFAFFSDVVN